MSEWIIPREDLEREAVRAGLEVHQQLRGRKLHSGKLVQPTPESMPDAWIVRRLHTTHSELGSIDTAAAREAARGRQYAYAYYDATASLVEADEEPPLPPSREALEAAVMLARRVKARILKESVVMRKIVIDGSNTSGFQRTLLIALEGSLQLAEGKVGIATITLEEDAASILRQEEGRVAYDLTRLGVPLIEIATHPDLTSASMARDAALLIGSLLRDLPQARRGLGTIRQDVNVSIPHGARVEIKGVQDVERMDILILKEVERQKRLIAWRKQYAQAMAGRLQDVTVLISRTDSRIVQRALTQGWRAMLLPYTHGRGMFSFMLTAGLWMGRELASFLERETGLKGFLHSDELPAYGLTEEDVAKLREASQLRAEDAFILILSPREKAEIAAGVLRERIRSFQQGIPREVRRAMEDLTTRYLRPMPGAARMYPETDLEPVRIPQHVQPPPTREEWESWFVQHGLREEEAQLAARSEWRGLLKRLVEEAGREGYLFLTEDITRITRELQVSLTSDGLMADGHIHPSFPREYVLEEAFSLLAYGRISAARYARLRWQSASREEAYEQTRPFTSDDEARRAIQACIARLPPQVKPGKALGMIMEDVKGRYPAEKLLKLIREALGMEKENGRSA